MSTGATRRTTRTTKRTQRTRKGKGGSSSSSVQAAGLVVVLMIVIFGGFVVFMNINYQKQKDAEARARMELERKLNAKVTLVVTAKAIERGAQITNEMLAIKEFPKTAAAAFTDAFANSSAPGLVGGYAKADIPIGQIILSSNLQKEPVIRQVELAENEVEVKVPISQEDQDAYFLEPGNIATVYSLFITGSGNKINTPITENARITYVKKQESLFTTTNPQQVAQQLNNPNSQPMIYIAVDKEDAKRLNQEMQERKQIKFLPEGEPAPPSTASILQIWTGVEVEEREIITAIGTTMASEEDSEEKGYTQY